MPATTPRLYQALNLLAAAARIETYGTWHGDSFTDDRGHATDVSAAIYHAVNGHTPHPFTQSSPEAQAVSRDLIQGDPEVMDTVRALAAHVYASNDAPASDACDTAAAEDPVDLLARWPQWLGVTTETVVTTMRDLAHTIAEPHTTTPAAA